MALLQVEQPRLDDVLAPIGISEHTGWRMPRLTAITAVLPVLILAGCIDRDPTSAGMPAIQPVAPPTLVKFKLFSPVEGISGIPWPLTDKRPDSTAMFKGPCDVHIEIDESHSYQVRVVAGMLSQDAGQLTCARLYLTA